MNRIYRFVIGSFFVSIVLLSLGIGQAKALDPRCDPEVWDIQQTQAQASVAIDTALAYELTKQNDSTLAMTCFSASMLETAKAGAIFSDVALPSGTLSTFLAGTFTSLLSSALNVPITTSGPNTGARSSTLMQDLDDTISGSLSNLMTGFAESITNTAAIAVGNYVSGLLGPLLGSVAGGLFGDFFGAATGLNSNPFSCNTMSVTWMGSTISTGVSGGTPYTSYDDIYNYSASATPIAGMAAAFQDRLDGASAILTKAENDQNVRLTPGGTASYRNVPALIGVNSSLVDVLGAMP